MFGIESSLLERRIFRGILLLILGGSIYTAYWVATERWSVFGVNAVIAVFAVTLVADAYQIQRAVHDIRFGTSDTKEEDTMVDHRSWDDTSLNSLGELEDKPDGVIITKHYWVMMALPAIVTIFSAIGWVWVWQQPDQEFKLVLAGLLLIAFGLMVGLPYVFAIRGLVKSVRSIDKPTLILRTSAVAGVVLFLGIGIYLLQRSGVSFEWVGNLIVFIGTVVFDLLKAATSSPENVMVAVIVLGLLKFVVQFIDWRINSLIIDGDMLTEQNGILRHDPGSVKISTITDLTPVRWSPLWWKMPWVKVTIETPGQEQALTNIHWMPYWFFAELETRVNGKKTGTN